MFVPPPLKLARPSQFDIQYSIRKYDFLKRKEKIKVQANTSKLGVVQNPIRARCCGFGEKDRRPIDPPPILELIATDSHGNRIGLK